MSTLVHTMKSVNDLLEVFDDKVCITPRGIMGFFNKGSKGTKTIPFASISAIQLKKSGFLSGYLQFTIVGGKECKGGVLAAAKDENTFTFDVDNDKVEQIKQYIERRMLEIRQPSAPPSTVSLADELAKLGSLKQQGLLSEDEFQAAKSRLLAR